MTFRSRVDIPNFVLLVGIIAALGSAVALLFGAGGVFSAVAWSVLVGVVLVFLVWLSTSYTFGEAELRVRSCGLSWVVPLSAISQIRTGFSVLSGPALAFNRIEIVYGPMKSIMVSPSDQERFLSE